MKVESCIILTSNLLLSRFAQMQELVLMLNSHVSRNDFSALATVTKGPTAFLKDSISSKSQNHLPMKTTKEYKCNMLALQTSAKRL